MPKRTFLSLLACILVVGMPGGAARAGDWPTWRYDAGRSAVSPETLPDELHLRWVRELAPPRPAWPASQTKLQFDASYEPVVAGRFVFVPSMVADRVTAYDTATGEEVWRFYTDGPVRFAPVAWDGRVAFVSDDGYLYCLEAETGKVVWKVRGGPADRRVLGNDRLISAWPARGAPVLADGTIYFAAGVWPFLGIFLHAVDADTGRIVWTNSGSGSTYLTQQHNSHAFAGVAPQGYLAVGGDKLLVSGGRTVPAAFDRATGRFLYFDVASRAIGKDAGGYEVVVGRDWFFNGGAMYRLEDGGAVMRTHALLPNHDVVVGFDDGRIIGYQYQPEVEEYTDADGKKRERTLLPVAWTATPDVPLTQVFLRAGDRVYAGGTDGLIAAVALPAGTGRAEVAWQGQVEGDVWTMLAADGQLFVVTRGGRLYCFGEGDGRAVVHPYLRRPAPPASEGERQDVEDLLAASRVRDGYCLVLGLGNGRTVEELIRRSDLYVIAVDPDETRVAAVRRRLDDAGVYGRRAAVHVGYPPTFPFPPYLANLVTSADLESAGTDWADELVRTVFRSLRPYGGKTVVRLSDEDYEGLKDLVAEAGLAGADVRRADDFAVLAREGALPGAADWTHQYADVGNTVVSRDTRVRLPLGLLWFGGPANDEVLPRHGHGPSPQVVGGRVILEGRDMLRAVDAYTGRLLWQRTFDDVGQYYDNTLHQPGANEIGSNYVSVEDGVYVVHGRECLWLDPATGATRKAFRLPTEEGLRGAHWGYVGVYGDRLVATAMPVGVELEEVTATDPDSGKSVKQVAPLDVRWNARYGAGSRWLLVLDRRTGEVAWKRKAAANFRHNAVVAGAGKVFCLDALSEARARALRFRGLDFGGVATLYALDAATGDVVWQRELDADGTWLGFSEEHDALLVAGSKSRDRAFDESAERVAVYRGRDGEPLWQNRLKYEGPCMIHGRTLITQNAAFDLLTGERRLRRHPLTGKSVPWSYSRNYGCNTSIASQHLILFRSAAAGYYDLAGNGGTGNLGGFKSGCTSNLIPAAGILNAPDYTRTCTCSYQNQCSVAFVHDPDVETWTFNSVADSRAPVERLGLNFGAPGDRLAANGTLWLDWPSVGGASPRVRVQVNPGDARPFRRHTSAITQGDLRWVAASGLEGVESVTVGLADRKNAAERAFTVRLYFAEPEDRQAGERVFHVLVQGEKVLDGFDVAAEARGPRRAVVREFKGVRAKADLKVEFEALQGEPLLCGLEIVAE